MQIMFVVVGDPGFQCADKLTRASPFREPEALFFERAHHALRIGITFWVVIAGKRLMNPQLIAGPHKGERGRLTPIVTHQGHALASGAIRELVINGHIQGRQPRPGCARPARIIAHNLFGIPILHHHDIDLPKILYQDLGHVDAPLFIGLGGSGFTPRRRPLGLELPVGWNQQAMRTHQAQHLLLVNWQLLHEAQIRSDPAVAPERVLRLERLNAAEQSLIAMGDKRGTLLAPSSPRRFFDL
jgi:hypothetical protein